MGVSFDVSSLVRSSLVAFADGLFGETGRAGGGDRGGGSEGDGGGSEGDGGGSEGMGGGGGTKDSLRSQSRCAAPGAQLEAAAAGHSLGVST